MFLGFVSSKTVLPHSKGEMWVSVKHVQKHKDPGRPFRWPAPCASFFPFFLLCWYVSIHSVPGRDFREPLGLRTVMRNKRKKTQKLARSLERMGQGLLGDWKVKGLLCCLIHALLFVFLASCCWHDWINSSLLKVLFSILWHPADSSTCNTRENSSREGGRLGDIPQTLTVTVMGPIKVSYSEPWLQLN